MTLDITETTAPRSDQQNFDDYATGSKTVTISEVRRGTAEQPVELHLVEFPGRPFKPSKTVRRILVAAWGPDASTYAGRRMTLFGDPAVKFGGVVVGGIRVSHLSHIDKTLELHLTATRGKRSPHVIEPLPDLPEPINEQAALDAIAQADDVDTLNAIASDIKQRGVNGDRGAVLAAWKTRGAELAEKAGE